MSNRRSFSLSRKFTAGRMILIIVSEFLTFQFSTISFSITLPCRLWPRHPNTQRLVRQSCRPICCSIICRNLNVRYSHLIFSPFFVVIGFFDGVFLERDQSRFVPKFVQAATTRKARKAANRNRTLTPDSLSLHSSTVSYELNSKREKDLPSKCPRIALCAI